MGDVLSSLRAFARTTWVPRVASGDPASASKLGGTPWLPAGSEHPVCGNCDRPLPLLVQLAVADLPDPSIFGNDGLVQLFYCRNIDPRGCVIDAEAWRPYAASVVARRVSDGDGGPSAVTAHEALPGQAIVGWESHADYPNHEELLLRGADADDAWELHYDDRTDYDQSYPRSGEKLGGWPRWIQDIAYPSCRTCGEQMELLFQIDSNCLMKIQFGDWGCAHLTQCPHHRDQLAFAWASC